MKGNASSTASSAPSAPIQEAARQPRGRDPPEHHSAPGWQSVLFCVRVRRRPPFSLWYIWGRSRVYFGQVSSFLPQGATAPKRPIVERDRGQPWTMGPLGHNIKPFLPLNHLYAPLIGGHPLKPIEQPSLARQASRVRPSCRPEDCCVRTGGLLFSAKGDEASICLHSKQVQRSGQQGVRRPTLPLDGHLMGNSEVWAWIIDTSCKTQQLEKVQVLRNYPKAYA